MNVLIAVLIGKNSMYKINLPKTAIGNYWLCDNNNKKIINIDTTSGKWYVISNSEARIIEPKGLNKLNNIDEVTIKRAILKEYNMYYVSIKGYSDLFILYCAPSFEEFIKLNIKDETDISIGNGGRKPYFI